MKKKLLKICAVFLAAALLVLAVGGIAIIRSMDGRGEPGGEILIVLGTTVNGTEPSPMLKQRLDAALEYLNTYPEARCIVTGGKGDENNLSEAQCMFNYLTAAGIDGSRITMEDRATSTVENFQFSLALIEAETGVRPEKLGVLSSEFHLLRARMFARQEGVTPVAIPARTTDLPTFARYFLREIVMVWYYA